MMNSAPGRWLPGALAGRCSGVSKVMEFAEWPRATGGGQRQCAVAATGCLAGSMMIFLVFYCSFCVTGNLMTS